MAATGPTVQQIELASQALAAPIWIDVMNLPGDRYGGASFGEPEAPAGLVRKKFYGHQSWFMAGTEPAPLAESGKPSEMLRILYPVSGMVVAIDAEVGEDKERIKLLAEPESPDLQARARWANAGANLGKCAMESAARRTQPAVTE